jgi:hypothetical protein
MESVRSLFVAPVVDDPVDDPDAEEVADDPDAVTDAEDPDGPSDTTDDQETSGDENPPEGSDVSEESEDHEEQEGSEDPGENEVSKSIQIQMSRCDELNGLLRGLQTNMRDEFSQMNSSLREASVREASVREVTREATREATHPERNAPEGSRPSTGCCGETASGARSEHVRRSTSADDLETDTGTPRSGFSVEYDSHGRHRNKKFDKVVYDEDREMGGLCDIEDPRGWSKHKKHRLRFCLWRLKYNRIVTAFYLDYLRKSEEYWSWLIVVISTITTGITVANNVEDEPIENYHVYINVMLNVSSMSTALIAAWIKKKGFVDKINEIDKYLIGVNQLCEELEIQLALLEGDRITYDEFKSKYLPQIIKFASNNPMIPPDVWKRCVRDITVKYPELVDPDSSEVNKMWPWFGDLVEYQDGDDTHHVRKPTRFMKHMKKTDTDRIMSSCCRKKKLYDDVYK